MLRKKIILILVLIFLFFALIFINYKSEEIVYKGFGWYGYLADDEINEEVLEKIKALGGNFVNINVYYEYDPENEDFILLSNLTKIEEKINLIHGKKLKVFLSPFVNLLGGHYVASQIKEQERFLEEAKNISITLAMLGQKNNVEIYSIWNELGLTLLEVSNSTDLTNCWLQETKEEVKKVFDGEITTKEGVQLGIYKNYNFSGFDYIGVTFYPFTSSCYTDVYSNITFCGVESLEEYEDVVNKEFERLVELKKKFKTKGIILGEIGIDVVGGEFVGKDENSNKIRAKAYEIVLRNGKGKIDGFFFNKFEHEDGGSEELDRVFIRFFQDSG